MKVITVYKDKGEELILQIAETVDGDIKGICQSGYEILVDGLPLEKNIARYQSKIKVNRDNKV